MANSRMTPRTSGICPCSNDFLLPACLPSPLTKLPGNSCTTPPALYIYAVTCQLSNLRAASLHRMPKLATAAFFTARRSSTPLSIPPLAVWPAMGARGCRSSWALLFFDRQVLLLPLRPRASSADHAYVPPTSMLQLSFSCVAQNTRIWMHQ